MMTSVVLMFFVIRLDRPSHTYNSWSRPARRTGDGGVQGGVGIFWLLEVISGEGGGATAAVGGSGGRPWLCRWVYPIRGEFVSEEIVLFFQ